MARSGGDPKRLFQLKEGWAIRIRLQLARQILDLALFNLAIDRKLRRRVLVHLRFEEVTQGSHVVARAPLPLRPTCPSGSIRGPSKLEPAWSGSIPRATAATLRDAPERR